MVTKKRTKVAYTATLRVLGKEYVASGESIVEAIGNLKPGVAKGPSVLAVEKGDKRQERIMSIRQTWRLFSTGGLVREILLKQTSNLFNL